MNKQMRCQGRLIGDLINNNSKLAENIVVSNNRVYRNSRLINESLVNIEIL